MTLGNALIRPVVADISSPDLKRRLKRDKPGLAHRIDLTGIHVSARQITNKGTQKHNAQPISTLPERNPLTLDQIEEDDWYPDPPT
jgi:hypothetical protein